MNATALKFLQNYYEAFQIFINIAILLEDNGNMTYFSEDENDFENEENLNLREFCLIVCKALDGY